jgi:hypothetical protein
MKSSPPKSQIIAAGADEWMNRASYELREWPATLEFLGQLFIEFCLTAERLIRWSRQHREGDSKRAGP